MKKLCMILALCCCYIVAGAQTITIVNNTSCSIQYILMARDQSIPCRGPGYYIGINTLQPNQPVTINAATATWSGAVPTGPIQWAVIDFISNVSCRTYGSTGCRWDAMSLYKDFCNNNIFTGCMIVNNTCNTCPQGTSVSASWVGNTITLN